MCIRDSNTTTKTPESNIKLENIEDYFQESDLDKFLRLALENGDYRLAIRIFYLMVIKLLTEKKLIDWKKNKPNYSYILEMSKYNHFDSFSKLTDIYERIWYGDRAIDKVDFEQLAIEFRSYQKVISAK